MRPSNSAARLPNCLRKSSRIFSNVGPGFGSTHSLVRSRLQPLLKGAQTMKYEGWSREGQRGGETKDGGTMGNYGETMGIRNWGVKWA